MVRAVLDANVFVSAFLKSQGAPGRILRHFLERRSFSLVMSVEILAELERTLSYPRVRKYLELSDEEIQTSVASLGVLASIVPGELEVHAVPADPDDDKYVAAALDGRAGVIVSGDHHLLEAREYQGVQIMSPRQFLEVLEALPPVESDQASDS